MNKESLNKIDQQAEVSLLHLHKLWQQSHTLPKSQKELLSEALEEHGVVLQELQVVVEELKLQNEELDTAHQLLETERQRYRDLFEFAPDGYIVTDVAAVIREANQAAGKLLNCSPQRLVGKPLLLFVDGESLRQFHTQVRQLSNSKNTVAWEVQIKPRNLASFPGLFRVAVVQDDRGRAIALRWLLHDVSLRKQDEAALEITRSYLEKQVEARTIELAAAREQLQQAIAQHQNLEAPLPQTESAKLNNQLKSQVQEQSVQLQKFLDFEAMLKRISDDVRDSLDERQILQIVVWELAVTLNIRGCNIGLYDPQLTTSTIAYEYTVGMDAAQGQVVKMQDFAQGYQQLLHGQYFQYCELVPTWHPVAILACPIFDHQGTIGDLCLFKQPDDAFTELEIRLVQQVANQCAIAMRGARLHQATQVKIQELETLNRYKDNFLDTVSHELRTPLATMKMAIQMLSKILNQQSSIQPKEKEQSKVDRYLQILQNECEREQNLVNNLLELQIADNPQPSVMTSIRIQDWLPQIVEPFQERAYNYKQSLSIDISPDLPRLICEPSSLGRAISELLNNACKYTPAGEKIVLTVRAQSGNMRFSICNSGVEIPERQLTRIFDKFYRLHSYDSSAQGGTGLGLAIVQQLVARIGGTILAESAKQQTCFIIELPLN